MRFSLQNNTSYSNINVLYNSSQTSDLSLFSKRTEQYSYGFNGKENDNEVVGTGSGTQDYGLRIYNPSLGRFLSVDPLSKEYPWNSTYCFAENDVIRNVDLDGAEKSNQTIVIDGKTKAILEVGDVQELERQGRRGTGHETIILERFFYESPSTHSWDVGDPANNQYMDEVVIQPSYSFMDDVNSALKKADQYVSSKKGNMDNATLEGREGQDKVFKAAHQISDVVGKVPVLGQVSKALDAVILIGETARDIEDGKYRTAATRLTTEYLGGKLEDAIDNNLKPGYGTKQAIEEGIDRAKDGAVEGAQKLDKNDL